MKKILLTGATGQVGFELCRILSFQEYEVHLGIPSSVKRKFMGFPVWDFDFSRPETVVSVLRLLEPDLIINPAAYTLVDQAEREKETCHLVNHKGVALLAEIAREIKSSIIHFSTDYVYDVKEPRAILETDSVGPKSEYAKSKLNGDLVLIDSDLPFVILRTSWVYGNWGNNFVKTMMDLGKKKSNLKIIDDQFGAPTNTLTLAFVVHRILSMADGNIKDFSGVYNICDQGETTWFGFACKIFEMATEMGLDLSVKEVTPISSEQFPTLAQRPKNSRLDISKISGVFNVYPPHWTVSLEQTLRSLFSIDIS